MACSQCKSERIISITGKCDDRFFARQLDNNVEHEGYVPYEIGMKGGDYIEFKYCLDCGQIQNWIKAEGLPTA